MSLRIPRKSRNHIRPITPLGEYSSCSKRQVNDACKATRSNLAPMPAPTYCNKIVVREYYICRNIDLKMDVLCYFFFHLPMKWISNLLRLLFRLNYIIECHSLYTFKWKKKTTYYLPSYPDPINLWHFYSILGFESPRIEIVGRK